MKEKSSRFIYWCVFLFYITLMTERVISLVLTLRDKDYNIFESGFRIYSYAMVLASLCVFLLLLFTLNRPFLMALFSRNPEVQSRVKPKRFSILIGVILISVMIHTAHTTLWLQFAAYGILIIGMIVANIDNLKGKKTDAVQWISLLYLIAYSMAIPVVYESNMPGPTLFYIVEASASIILIGLFTFMVSKVFSGTASNLLYVEPLHIAMFLNIAVLWLRWDEEINYFVLISTAIAIVLWLVGKYRK